MSDDKPLHEQLAESTSPWSFSRDLKKGDSLLGRDGYPDLEIISNELELVKRLEVQLVRVKSASTGEDVLMRRLIAILQDGKELDVGERFAVPSILVEKMIDTSKCEACMEKIAPEDLVIYEGAAYHKECME